MAAFSSIRPGEIDTFQFNFELELGTGIINGASWTCVLSPENIGTDPDPSSRLISTSTFDSTRTSCRVGNMIDGCTYVLTATITTSDSRILILSGDLDCLARPDADDGNDDVLTIEEFRATFSAFSDPTIYSDPAIAFWIAEAVKSLDPNRWGQTYSLGVRLYVAHMLTVNAWAGRGGIAIGSGVPASRSVGGVSVSYDNELGAETDAGNWNTTVWGQQYIRLARMAGAGGYQL